MRLRGVFVAAVWSAGLLSVAEAAPWTLDFVAAIRRKWERRRILRRILGALDAAEDFAVYGDYYAVMGLGPTADHWAIKRAWKARVLAVHPDKNRHTRAAEAFNAVQVAYDTLSDKDKRRAFDRDHAVHRQRVQEVAVYDRRRRAVLRSRRFDQSKQVLRHLWTHKIVLVLAWVLLKILAAA